MRVGLFGGRFDPLHIGHLLLAEQALETLELHRVCFVPAKLPPHKQADGDPEDRYAMALLGTAGHERFEVSRVELDREGPSYTFDTVRDFGEAHPNAKVFLLLGVDAAAGLEDWHRPHDLVRACTVVTFPRPGEDLGGLSPDLADHVRTMEGRLVEASGTEIRARVAAGRSIRFLVPQTIETYIRKRGLYTR